jgi:hypothetical protein
MQPHFIPTSYEPASISGASALPPAVKVTTVIRLSSEVYRKFEESLPQAVIDKNSPDAGCDAAFKLGIQYILRKLRTDLVVE